MSSQVVESVGDVNPPSNLDSKPEGNDVEARLGALWAQMNKAASNKTVKPSFNKQISTATSSSSQKPNDNWIKYLGLASKDPGAAAQDAQRSGSAGGQSDSSNVDEKVASIWEQMNKGIPKRRFESCLKSSNSAVGQSSLKISDNWMTVLGLSTNKGKHPKADALQDKPGSGVQNGSSEEARKLAAAALASVKNAVAAASGRGKIEITEVRDFAGQEVEVRKFVDAESKEAAEKARAPASSAVDAVLEQIKKKQKLSVLDKSKMDWGEFKEEKKLDEELDAYKKSSNQYLDKVSFLQRTDYREFERERDARLALQARRRPDMREDP